MKYLLCLLLPSVSWAGRVVSETVPTTNAVVVIDTTNKHLDLSTKTYSGGTINVSLFTSSNVVISIDGTDRLILYATGQILINGVSVSTQQGGPFLSTIAASGVTPGIYPTNNLYTSSFTVNAAGQLTSASSILIGAVDPPGSWTCTLRTGAASGAGINGVVSSSVSCVGNEKVISGGCRLTTPSSACFGRNWAPTGQGGVCDLSCNVGNSETITAVANCCL